MKNKRKISILQTLRFLVQILLFIFLPTLYIEALNGVKIVYLAILNHSFDISTAMPQLIAAIAVLPITVILGRFFCGWMCGFGSFTDFIYQITHKIFRKKYKINERADSVLKFVKYIILTVLIVAVWSLNITLFSTVSPWDAFGTVATVGKAPDFSYAATNITIGFIILIAVLIASAFIERFFCRYLCPMGAVFAIISKLRIAKIKKPTAQCGNCRICTNNCAMGIPLYKSETINSGECINCMKCVTACPRGNTTFTVAKEDVRPLVAGAVTVATIAGMYYVGDFATNTIQINTSPISTQISSSAANSSVSASSETNSSSSTSGSSNSTAASQSSKADSASSLYKDGTYQGNGTGFRGGTTTVSVTIQSGKITNITPVSYNDDAPFFNRAYSSISQQIISSQSSNVDSVSGATFSSNGIMQAVENALSQAKA